MEGRCQEVAEKAFKVYQMSAILKWTWGKLRGTEIEAVEHQRERVVELNVPALIRPTDYENVMQELEFLTKNPDADVTGSLVNLEIASLDMAIHAIADCECVPFRGAEKRPPVVRSESKGTAEDHLWDAIKLGGSAGK
jgi:hypothetical protein